MKVWTNIAFPVHYPVGTAAVVVADTAAQAAELLNDACEAAGIGRPAKAEQFKPLPTSKPAAVILNDGDY